MKKNHLPKYSALSLAMLSLLATESLYAGANFSITPAQSFPVQNTATGVLPVYYTVTNLIFSVKLTYSGDLSRD